MGLSWGLLPDMLLHGCLNEFWTPMEGVGRELPRGVPYQFERFLMMVDQYTKWVECVTLPSQTVEVTAKEAVDNFEIQMSVSSILRTRPQVSKLCAALWKALQIHKSMTSPKRPLGCNGKTENYTFNKLLMDAIVYFIGMSRN